MKQENFVSNKFIRIKYFHWKGMTGLMFETFALCLFAMVFLWWNLILTSLFHTKFSAKRKTTWVLKRLGKKIAKLHVKSNKASHFWFLTICAIHEKTCGLMVLGENNLEMTSNWVQECIEHYMVYFTFRFVDNYTIFVPFPCLC